MRARTAHGTSARQQSRAIDAGAATRVKGAGRLELADSAASHAAFLVQQGEKSDAKKPTNS